MKVREMNVFFLELATRGIKFLFDIPMVMYSSKLSVYNLHLPKNSPRKLTNDWPENPPMNRCIS